MLAYTHAPQNHGALSSGKFTRDFAQGGGRNPADGCHRFWAIALDVFFQRIKVVCTVADEVNIHQALFNDRINHGIEHRHIGIGFELQSAPCVLADIGDTRISQHNLGAFFGGILHPSGSYWMVVGGVGANHQNQTRMLDIVDLVTHCARAHTLQQCSHTGSVAQAGAVVYVIRSKTRAN